MEERQDRAEKMNRWRMMRHHPRSLASSLLVSASVALSGCSGDFAGAQTGIPSDAAAVQLHVLASGSNSTMSTRERLVVRDAATLETVWPRIVGNVLPAPPVPVVDFGANVVIVAAMGARSTGGYAIAIDEARTAHGDAWISVIERAPGDRCLTTQAFTAPFVMVAVPRFSGEASFVERTAIVQCG